MQQANFSFCAELPPVEITRRAHRRTRGLPEPLAPVLAALSADHFHFLWQTVTALFVSRPTETVSDWACRCIRFNEPENRGAFSLENREYIREALDSWADLSVTDEVAVFGSQTGKTGMFMAGAGWTIRNDPSRVFWVMPTRDTVTNFSRSRWMPLIEASPDLARLIPLGNKRHNFATTRQHIGASIVDMVWSNSPAALSSVPARVVLLDEVDKFNSGGKGEADAVSLADQRTKNMVHPKKIKASTPTLASGLIWQELLKTDVRRRFLPCPHCKKFVVLSWSKRMTEFPVRGDEAWIIWDKEARRKDGTWDLDRVEASARAECSHCGGAILDGQKSALDRSGKWIATQSAARGFRGYHLPSLYAAGPETTFGKLAVKFLQQKRSLTGLQGFVNGDLAEPWRNQEDRGERIEIIVKSDAEPLAEAEPIMSVDYQHLEPRFWFAIRTWKNHSRMVDFGALETWEDIRKKQLEHNVRDALVGIESGFNAQEVYSNCLRFGKLVPRRLKVPAWSGWWPMKGSPRRQSWPDPRGGARPYGLADAAIKERGVWLPLLMFSVDSIKDALEDLRAGKTAYRWEETEKADEEYFLHQDAETRRAIREHRSRRLTVTWTKRTDDWPDHLRDCNVMQIVLSLFHGFLLPTPRIEAHSTKPQPENVSIPANG